MKIKRSKIKLENLQIKSVEQAKALAQSLAQIEAQCGIHEVKISVRDFFVCPWIKASELQGTPMEKLVADLFLETKQIRE